MKINISLIKKNEDNPRKISDGAFEKLVASIKEDPQMLEVRPLVIDENNMVLGGNMRLKALEYLGYVDIPVMVAKGWTDEEKRRFIIKDNVSGGEWDYELLNVQYDVAELEAWGLNVEKELGSFNAGTEDDQGDLTSIKDINIKEIISLISRYMEQEKMPFESVMNELWEKKT